MERLFVCDGGGECYKAMGGWAGFIEEAGRACRRNKLH